MHTPDNVGPRVEILTPVCIFGKSDYFRFLTREICAV